MATKVDRATGITREISDSYHDSPDLPGATTIPSCKNQLGAQVGQPDIQQRRQLMTIRQIQEGKGDVVMGEIDLLDYTVKQRNDAVRQHPGDPTATYMWLLKQPKLGREPVQTAPPAPIQPPQAPEIPQGSHQDTNPVPPAPPTPRRPYGRGAGKDQPMAQNKPQPVKSAADMTDDELLKAILASTAAAASAAETRLDARIAGAFDELFARLLPITSAGRLPAPQEPLPCTPPDPPPPATPYPQEPQVNNNLLDKQKAVAEPSVMIRIERAGGFGFEAPYHAVIVEGDVLVLAYDTRYKMATRICLPSHEEPDTQYRLTIALSGRSEVHMVANLGIQFTHNDWRYQVLMIVKPGSEPLAEPQDV